METTKPTTRGDQTRTALIDAAFALFTDRGYHGTSMRQIAQGAGLALGGIYNHFNGKEAIFLAVIRAYHPYREVVAALAETDAPSPEVYFRHAAQQMVSALKRD